MLRTAVVFLLIAVVAAGGFVLAEPAAIEHQGLMRTFARSYGSWFLGLAMGLIVAWLAHFDWLVISRAAVFWVVGQRRNAGWIATGLVCSSVLIFF